MTLIKAPMKGMPEQTPKVMKVRNYVQSIVQKIYSKSGFMQIDAPSIESIENLTSKQGGENEQLIFKILKRGDKLKLGTEIAELTDCGLRYDLTLPLCRFYANNQENLPTPFKTFQIGNVWRADRPQKGRFRQFTQCDIDILGDSSNLAEIELIYTTYKALCALNFKNAVIRVNDRRLLKAMAECAGFNEEQFSQLFITLDKLDKIGLVGVKEELEKVGFDKNKVEKYVSFFENSSNLINCSNFLEENLKESNNEVACKNLDEIINTVRVLSNGKINIVYDPSLVRGMGYYTGSIFEIQLQPYNYSIGGGGRYDELIGKFTGHNVSACGFSLGFERIVQILCETGFEIPNSNSTKIFFIEKECPLELKTQILQYADSVREKYDISVVVRNKNLFHQKQQFEKNGITEFYEINSLSDFEKLKNNL